eukprot:SAG25_NODE_2240_length_1805_cov_2.093787_1_plen_76_part_10
MARRCDRLKREHVEAMLDHDEVARAAATGLLARASLPEAMSDLNRQYPPQGGEVKGRAVPIGCLPIAPQLALMRGS